MKNLFLINEEERNRILGMHETATKRHYLSEQQTTENVIRLTESDLKKTIEKVLLWEDVESLPDMKNVPLGKVQSVQQALVDAGYNIGPTGVDGVFGANTRSAVLKYQKDNGIKQTGNVGSITSKRLGVQQLTSVKPSQSQTRTATTQKKTTVPQTNTNKTIVPNNNNKFKLKGNFKDKEFNTVTKDTFSDTFKDVTLKKQAENTIKSMANTQKEIGKISEKTYQQLNQLKTKGELKKYSFIIINKDNAIASLFGINYKFITNSSITTGQVKDKGVGKDIDNSTYKQWMLDSLEYAKKNPKSKEGAEINNWLTKYKTKTGLINKDNSINFPVYLTLLGVQSIEEFPYSYVGRTESGKNVTPSGVFGIGSGDDVKGYAGAGSENAFPLINPDSVGVLGPAIHGYAGDKRGDLINKFSKQDINTSKDLSRAGAGCINVTPKFLSDMRKYNPSYVIILPDTGGVVDVKVTTFQNFKVKLTQLGGKCVKSLSSLFS
jgi:peptidoglycan hydrolase-like protein with peptidoglycan-binding domain